MVAAHFPTFQPVQERHAEQVILEPIRFHHQRRDRALDQPSDGKPVERYRGRVGMALAVSTLTVYSSISTGRPAARAAVFVRTTELAPVSSTIGTLAPLMCAASEKSPVLVRTTSTLRPCPAT